ncbi:MAG TPA: glycosyltransferase family 2 protein [Spongiibacteraceae bacterium]|nr:glycosyltransferase family 2 protein [Spongiibacteraceae bacterium]
MSDLQFSVVIPVKDEAANIRQLLAEIHAAVGTYPQYEVIVVEDGSTDETLTVLRAIKSEQANAAQPLPLVIVKNPHNLGQSTSILMGVRQARFPWIVTLDGDGQNDPADIPKLLQCALDHPGTDLIAGQRTKRRDSWNKRIASRIANKIRASLLRDGTPDTGCGLKAIRRDMFLALPYFNHMHRYLPALVRRHRGSVQLVGVNHRHRTEGRSKYGTLDRAWVGIWDLLGVMWLMRRNRLPATAPTVE